ncbi:hypothetical protein Amal_00673 [Acetobacter malorum]|uniref:Uncharacterized protein n=1 Tax=Acetobacter malorum TaxID=178901 RepID=A0A177GEF5_9PROT|nr:hypothetical protein Amal_00673 [Acetobacter malorum]
MRAFLFILSLRLFWSGSKANLPSNHPMDT